MLTGDDFMLECLLHTSRIVISMDFVINRQIFKRGVEVLLLELHHTGK